MGFNKKWLTAKTLGDLKTMDYRPKTVKEELRENLIEALKTNKVLFEGVHGYDETVIPDMERAILSKHNIILLGLRGQAKTRIARQMVNLLDEYIPVVAGSELNDDPFHPISRYARDLVAEKGDDTPIAWMHRSERFTEKLATPDVSTADLIGDVDPIKAATLKLPYSDERVIHYGLVPHANRGIFIINELPDLQPRIQVSLFNILQEGDIQIRGFKLRLPLDIQFIFTANPEDYTNRGSIVTPLKDRIESQILTHHPKMIEISRQITEQEARLSDWQRKNISIPHAAKDLIELIAITARDSEYVDQKSGVSARLTIAAYELLMSTVERRALLHGEKKATVRVTDLWRVIPAITGKVELVYEGEQEGPAFVADKLISEAVKRAFNVYFNTLHEFIELKDEEVETPYKPVLDAFAANTVVRMLHDLPEKAYIDELQKIKELQELTKDYLELARDKEEHLYFYMELLLFGLSEHNLINRTGLENGISFNDFLSGMFSDDSPHF